MIIIYRFSCSGCGYLKDHEVRDDVPEICPACGKSKSLANKDKERPYQPMFVQGRFEPRNGTN